jgi:biotin carboxyl carrier protein
MAGRFALLIGNSTFNDPGLARLAAPENDVIALKEVLERSEVAGFETRLLLNAGMVEARDAVFDLFDRRSPDDLLLLYYTGHGLRDERGDLYLALPQTSAKAPGRIALEADFVRKQMQNSYSRRQVLILDCCHSGAFVRPGAKGAEVALSRDDFLPAGGHGRYILAAAAASESAFEAEGRSIFTRHLVDALKNGEAAPERETITIEDLHTYVCRRVASEQAPMQPRIWVDEQTEPLIIARNPNPRRPLPQVLVDMLWGQDVHHAHSAAIRLLAICRGADRTLGADAERVLRQRLEKPEDLAFLVASPILDALGPQTSEGLAAEVEALKARLAAAGEATALRDAEVGRLEAETAALRRRVAELEARVEAVPAPGSGPATAVVVPPLGESISEVTVVKWLKRAGDPVAQGEAVCELDTEKVTVEVESPVGGTLTAIVAPAGATVPAGARLGEVTPGPPAKTKPARIGRAEVRRVFNVPGVGKVAGGSVTEGRLLLGAPVRVLRGRRVQYKGWIKSLQCYREDVREAEADDDFGMTCAGFDDFEAGDVIEAFDSEQTR